MITVDWTELSHWDYFNACMGNVVYVANAIHTAIKKLSELFNINPGPEFCDFAFSFRFFGHSLGSHISAKVGKLFLDDKPSCTISLIVAMDPAGPRFDPLKNKRYCLTHTDAKKVIVFHAAIEGSLAPGITIMLGHEDYYLNGGVLMRVKMGVVYSHKRVLNVVRRLIRGEKATGYYTSTQNQQFILANQPNDLQEIRVNINEIINIEDVLVRSPDPIYLEVSLDEPFFRDPTIIPAHTRKPHGKANTPWVSVKFSTVAGPAPVRT